MNNYFRDKIVNVLNKALYLTNNEFVLSLTYYLKKLLILILSSRHLLL